MIDLEVIKLELDELIRKLMGEVERLHKENDRLRHIHCECEYSEPCPNEAEIERLHKENDCLKAQNSLLKMHLEDK
jgi:hypothetical protein